MRFSVRSLMPRLILTYCIIVIPLLSAIIAINAYLNREDAENRINAVEAFSEQVEANLETRVRVCQNALESLASNPDVIAFSLYGNSSAQDLSDAYIYSTILTDLRKLASNMTVQTDVYRVMLHFGNSHLPNVNNLMCFDADIASGAWTDRLQQWKEDGCLYGTDTYLHYQDVPESSVGKSVRHHSALSLYKPVYREIRGSLAALCEIDIRLSDLLSDLTSQEYDGIYEYMALVENGPDGRNVLYSTGKAAAPLLAQMQQFPSGSTSVRIDGVQYHVFVHPCACVAADLIILIPDGALVSPTSGRLMLLTLLALAGLSIIILSFILSRYVLRGLRELSDVIGRFGREKDGSSLTRRIQLDQKSLSRSSDEIRDIALQFNEMAGRIESLMRDVENANTAEKNAIYSSLAAQIHPHFICNALDMLRIRAIQSSDTVMARSVERLMTYFRYNASAGMRVSLADELENLRDYIDIVNQIRSDVPPQKPILLTVHVSSQKNPCDCAVLKFILQPLAENAVKYAFPNGQAGQIDLDISDTPDGRIKVTMSDNGAGMSRERLNEVTASLFAPKKTGSVGLQNIAQRMVYTYTKDSFDIRSVEGFGTLVTLIIPFEKMNG